MASSPPPDEPRLDAAQTAVALAKQLDERGLEYAIGGALALGAWTARPRGTIDADINLFLPPEDTDGFLDVLIELGCEFDWVDATKTLCSHGFCRVAYQGRVVDFFVPLNPFHDEARRRRVRKSLCGVEVALLDAETICVFKMMFFRGRDLGDIEEVLKHMKAALDRPWIEERLIGLFGARDPRVVRWRELAEACPPD